LTLQFGIGDDVTMSTSRAILADGSSSLESFGVQEFHKVVGGEKIIEINGVLGWIGELFHWS
jgi:hypothetical protein